MDVNHEDALMAARREVQAKRGLKKLPAATHADVVALLQAGGPEVAAKIIDTHLAEAIEAADVSTYVEPTATEGRGEMTPRAFRKAFRALPFGSEFFYGANRADRRKAASLKRKVKKGEPMGRILRAFNLGGGQVARLHATRGWLVERAA